MRVADVFSKWTPDGINHGWHGFEIESRDTPRSPLTMNGFAAPVTTIVWRNSREEAEDEAEAWENGGPVPQSI